MTNVNVGVSRIPAVSMESGVITISSDSRVYFFRLDITEGAFKAASGTVINLPFSDRTDHFRVTSRS